MPSDPDTSNLIRRLPVPEATGAWQFEAFIPVIGHQALAKIQLTDPLGRRSEIMLTLKVAIATLPDLIDLIVSRDADDMLIGFKRAS